MRNTEDVSLGDRLSDISEGLLCKGKRGARIYRRRFAKESPQNNRQLNIKRLLLDSQTYKTNLWLPKGKRGGVREGFKLGVWISRLKTTIDKLDKQQGPNIEHRKLYLISPINHNKVKVKLHSHVQLFATPWTTAHQAHPPSMGFSR